jgi:ribosome-associated protein
MPKPSEGSAERPLSTGYWREIPSRTEKRREARTKETRLIALALELVALKPKQIERLGLDEELREAVTHAQSLEDRRARNRHMGVVRQQLRTQADDGQELEARVAALKGLGAFPSVPPTPPPARVVNEALEGWVDRLAEEGDAALEEFFRLYTEADRQAVRQAARAAGRARQNGLPASAAEQRLRAVLEQWF